MCLCESISDNTFEIIYEVFADISPNAFANTLVKALTEVFANLFANAVVVKVFTKVSPQSPYHPKGCLIRIIPQLIRQRSNFEQRNLWQMCSIQFALNGLLPIVFDVICVLGGCLERCLGTLAEQAPKGSNV